MIDKRIKVNSVVQANEKAEAWSAAMLIVQEIHDWGVLAYMKVPYSGSAFIRLGWDKVEYVGEAILVLPDSEDETEE